MRPKYLWMACKLLLDTNWPNQSYMYRSKVYTEATMWLLNQYIMAGLGLI